MKIYSFNEITNKGKNARELHNLLKSNKVFKLSRGLYSYENIISEEALICKKNKFAVITLLSAFYCHHFTTYIPEKIYICIPRNGTRINTNRTISIYENDDLHNIGITTIKKDGYPIRIYNLERLLIELFKHAKHFSFEQYKEIINHYRQNVNKLDWQKIASYLSYLEPKYKKFVFNKIMSEIK